MISNDFINECKNGANANRLGKITIDGEQTILSDSDKLASFTVNDGCYVDGNIIGTVCSKKLEVQLVDTDYELDIVDKKINPSVGIKYANNSEEWLGMGKYTVEHPNDEQTANLTQITAYDELDLLNKPYICSLIFEDNDVCVADFYEDVCNQLELTPKTLEILNGDIPVVANPFVNNESLRFVLQEIEKVSCSFCEIDNDTNEIDLVWLSDSEEPDYEFTTEDYSTLEGGKVVYGPINTLVLKYSQIDGENATMQDQESIEEYGVNELAIEDSYFLYTEELKWQAIEGIWERVHGLTYTDCKLTTYYGKPFLKIGQKIRINTNDERVIDTYVLKHTFTYDGTYTSTIESPVLTKQETKTKNTSITEVIRQTEIKVDKAEGNITATTRKVQDVEDNLNNNFYTKTNVNELIQNAETGVTNTFSEAGGNNIFRNTGLWFESDENNSNNMLYPSSELFPSDETFLGEVSVYEYWNGNVKKSSNINATDGNSMLLQVGKFAQEQEVPNGNYSISFYYQKLIQLANATVTINDKQYSLDSMEVKQFYTGEQNSETGEYITQPITVTAGKIKIEFYCDTSDGVEIYDLMCNKGAVRLAYSQNQNETTTDTVNISKGITITSSNMATIFKANANGIKILTLQNAVIAYFTDKGLSTKELIVENKAQMVGTLVQEVGDQTWFIRM